MKCATLIGLLLGVAMNVPSAFPEPLSVQTLKQAILERAESFKGQGDPDGSKQKELESLVNQLIEVAPQPSAKDRLPLIIGAWQQVWGPYIYKDNSRGVDPTLDPQYIYQVVFPDGYYYNVNPRRDKKAHPKGKTVLLRGEYRVDSKQKDILNIQFTNLRSVQGTPPIGLTYIQLPELSEAKQIKQRSILPSFFVRWFFGGGSLREVYTDADLRITFGSSQDHSTNNYIYVLQRVKP